MIRTTIKLPIRSLSVMMAFLLPLMAYSQRLRLVGNVEFFVATNQGLYVPDGLVVQDNARNILPSTLTLDNGTVLLDAATALYKIHSVPASGSAVFYSAFPSGNRPATYTDTTQVFRSTSSPGSAAGLTVVNGASGVSDFTLKLDAATDLGASSLPVVWEVSQATGSGVGDITFTWDASLEPVTLSNKQLYKYVSGAWTLMPKDNTTAGAYSLIYTGYTGALSSTRFGVAAGLSAMPVTSDPLCTGGTGSLTVTADGGLGTRSYKLNNGSWQSSNQFTGLSAGTYTVYVKDDAGDEVSEMVTITDPPPVTAVVTGDLNVCSGESTTLTATGGASYAWNGTLGTNEAITVSPTVNTTYSVSVTDANGCLSTALVTVQIYVVQPPVVTFADNSGLSNDDGTICAGSSVNVNVTGGISYAWPDGSTSSLRQFTPACTSPYTLTVTDANGCTITSNLTITLDNTPTVTQIAPSSGSTGTVIHIYGNSLNNVTEVKLNGQTGTNLMILSSTHISVSWPSGGSLQQVSFLSPCGTTNIPLNTPVISSIAPGAGSVGTMITLTGTNLDQLVSASVGGVDAVILSQSPTAARIVVMPGASTGSVSVANAVSTGTYSSSFTVNPTPFPYFQQRGKLSNSSLNAVQGSAVFISADGNTALVGAPGDNTGRGAAWVYTRSGTLWSQQSKLVGAGAVGAARQGTSVALSADGNTAVVGGPDDNSKAGAVWVFKRSGTSWTQQGGKLVGTGAIGAAQQGINVSVSGDGTTIASGGFADNNYVGAAWTFAQYGTSWAQLGDKITGSSSVGAARQGASLSLSENGSRLAIGGYQDNNRQGAVWMFERNDCDWTQQGPKLVGTGGGTQAWQGYSASLSASGNTLVVGGNSDNSLVGAAWVYTYAGGNWTQQARLVGTQAAGAAKQGSSVTLSADGNTIMLGGLADDSNQGAVWVFKKSGSSWTQQGAKIKGSGATGAAKQGSSVSLSANGTTALIGGPTDNTNKGAFWVYVPANTIPSMLQPVLDERSGLAGELRLDQNIPNPFNGSTMITFSVPEACMVEWEISDASGRVITLLRRQYQEGENSERFDLSGNSGVFYYRMKTPFGTAVKKMLIVK